MENIYLCKNCKTIFMLPAEITNGLGIEAFVCPKCKIQTFRKIAS